MMQSQTDQVSAPCPLARHPRRDPHHALSSQFHILPIIRATQFRKGVFVSGVPEACGLQNDIKLK